MYNKCSNCNSTEAPSIVAYDYCYFYWDNKQRGQQPQNFNTRTEAASAGTVRNPTYLMDFLKFLSLQYIFEAMTAIQLKTLLIHRISAINDVSFLKALKTILDSKTESGVIQLSQEQLDDIIASKKEIELGLSIENIAFEKEVKQWLNAK